MDAQRRALLAQSRQQLGLRSPLIARTGGHCPFSGAWSTAADGQDFTVWLNEGQIMPPAGGSAADWTHLSTGAAQERAAQAPASATKPSIGNKKASESS
jgi:hypothetical protein